MTQPEGVEAVAARLRAIDWQENDDRTRSRVALLREYLRRAARWAGHLDSLAEWPFFDIAARVNSAIRADPDLVARLNNHLARQPIWNDVRRTCEWTLHWAALRAAPGVDLPALEDPFEPLIRMYERGGGFTRESGFFQVDLAGFPRRSAEDYLALSPLLDLDDAALDEIDRNSVRP